MTHDVTVSAAECAECIDVMPYKDAALRDSVHREHLQAQKDALWRAAVKAWTQLTTDNVITYLLMPGQTDDEAAADLHRLEDALRAQMEAKHVDQ